MRTILCCRFKFWLQDPRTITIFVKVSECGRREGGICLQRFLRPKVIHEVYHRHFSGRYRRHYNFISIVIVVLLLVQVLLSGAAATVVVTVAIVVAVIGVHCRSRCNKRSSTNSRSLLKWLSFSFRTKCLCYSDVECLF